MRWTGDGVPHVVADDLASAGYGQGYAFASLHVCAFAEQIVKVRGERARFFGPGPDNAYVDGDVAIRSLDVMGIARRALASASADARALLRGFADGYNRFLRDTPADGLPPACARAPWVRPIAEDDLAAYVVSVGMLGSAGYFLGDIARATPPASNGWAFGAERTANGRGLLVANPHFPWDGPLRFYESHVTVRGDFDVYGANLLGVPLVSIGFTDRVAWTHTFSASRRVVLYRLTLDPDRPTRYRIGDRWHDMTARQVAVDVRLPDGRIERRTHTSYTTVFGPVVESERLPWTGGQAFALRDVSLPNQPFDQYLAIARATGVDGVRRAIADYQGTPFVNTIAADRDGNVWYGDGSAVPDFTPAGAAAWALALRTVPEVRAAYDLGVVAADGALSVFALANRNPARPFSIPLAHAPQLRRRDYVLNANDSYWLTNASAPLTGFSPLYGPTGEPASLRTRMNHLLVAEVKRFTMDAAKRQIVDNRALSAVLLREPVVARCRRGGPRIARACDTLAAWDGRFSVDSVGAVLWRELWAELGDDPWAVPFDPRDPIGTPRGLAPAPVRGPDPVVDAIARAVDRLRAAGIDPYDTPLGAVQYTVKAGTRYPVPGSLAREGSVNPVAYRKRHDSALPRATTRPEPPINPATGLTRDGYAVDYGTSFLLVVGFDDDGPRAEAVLTYSNSSDPRSPHFADQTARWGTANPWRPVRYRAADIDADPALRVVDLREPRAR